MHNRQCVIYHCTESVRIASILLLPFIPDAAARILDILGVAPDRRTFAHAAPNADRDYGTPIEVLSDSTSQVIFPDLSWTFKKV